MYACAFRQAIDIVRKRRMNKRDEERHPKNAPPDDAIPNRRLILPYMILIHHDALLNSLVACSNR